jgi:hypothetical protein
MTSDFRTVETLFMRLCGTTYQRKPKQNQKGNLYLTKEISASQATGTAGRRPSQLRTEY